MHGWVTRGVWGCRFFSDLDVGALSYKKIVPIEIFNISFESTQNKLQYGIKITSTEARKPVRMIRN